MTAAAKHLERTNAALAPLAEALAAKGISFYHADAQEFPCRCCATGIEGRYVAFMGGADTRTTAEFLIHHCSVSWGWVNGPEDITGLGSEIVEVLRAEGWGCEWDGTASRCISITAVRDDVLRQLPSFCHDCGEYDCECGDAYSDE